MSTDNIYSGKKGNDDMWTSIDNTTITTTNWPTTTISKSEGDIIKETLSKVKLINLLGEKEQIKLITDGDDIFDYIINPSGAVISVHDGLNNL